MDLRSEGPHVDGSGQRVSDGGCFGSMSLGSFQFSVFSFQFQATAITRAFMGGVAWSEARSAGRLTTATTAAPGIPGPQSGVVSFQFQATATARA